MRGRTRTPRLLRSRRPSWSLDLTPILVDSKAGIIAGHGRFLAARKLGLAEVPVVVLDHLTETQRRAYIIADNKLAQNAGWDEEVLRRGTRVALERWFRPVARRVLRRGVGKRCWRTTAMVRHRTRRRSDSGTAGPAGHAARRRVVDRRPPVDLWRLPRSRCDVRRLLDGQRANVVITSPPYATQREYDPTSGFKPVPPEEYVEWFARVAANIAVDPGSRRLLLPEHQGARRRRRAESVRDGPRAGAPAAVGMAVCG